MKNQNTNPDIRPIESSLPTLLIYMSIGVALALMYLLT